MEGFSFFRNIADLLQTFGAGTACTFYCTQLHLISLSISGGHGFVNLLFRQQTRTISHMAKPSRIKGILGMNAIILVDRILPVHQLTVIDKG